MPIVSVTVSRISENTRFRAGVSSRTIARPNMKAVMSAEVMPMTGGISSMKYAGNVCTPAVESIVPLMIRGKTASDTQKANPPANRVDAYDMPIVIRSIRPAPTPVSAMAGATSPSTMNGTKNLMN